MTQAPAWMWIERTTTLVTLVASAVVIWWLVLVPRSNEPADDRRIQQPVEDVSETAQLPTRVLGSRDASVAIIEFGDFKCQFCARHANETLPAIRRMFVDTGIALYAFRHYPLKERKLAGSPAAIAECAAKQDLFWPTHLAIFSTPGALEIAELTKNESLRDLNVLQLTTCATGENGEPLPALEADIAEAQRLQVRATPTFFVGRLNRQDGTVKLLKRINGAQSVRVFESIVKWARVDRPNGSTH